MRIHPHHEEGYDVAVPNKTIYVSEGDLPLYQRAQELAGGNLSAAISQGARPVRRLEEAPREGYEEVIVRRGSAAVAERVASLASSSANAGQRHSGRALPRLPRPHGQVRPPRRAEAADWMVDAEGKPAGWRGWIGIGDVHYGSAPRSRRSRSVQPSTSSAARFRGLISTWWRAPLNSQPSKTSTSARRGARP